MTSVWHHIADPIRRSRVFWGGVCWVASLLMAGFGTTYLIFGLNATAVPQVFAILTVHLPGGVRTYGATLLLPALCVIHGLVTAMHRGLTMLDDYLHHALVFEIVVALGAAGLFVMAWATSGVPTWGSILLWLAVAALAALAWALPPDAPVCGRGA